jgi:FKBP12-rapamycin complex-associated protein
LHQLEAAQGLLKYAREQLQVPIKTTWYEKVQRWTAALEQYDKQQLDFPDDLNIMLGRMRCMASLSDWEGVSNLVDTALKRTDLTAIQRTEVATISLSSALNLMRWEKMDECITYLDENLLDAAFYRAIIAVHNGQYNESQGLIDKARELAATELTALLGESYNRAYDVVVRIQQLTELEEVVTYKKLSNDLEKRELLRKLWRKRLEGVERNVEVWQAILAVRSLVVPPTSDPETWIKFANLVRKSARPRKARKILTQLLVGAGKDLKFTDPIPDTSPM